MRLKIGFWTSCITDAVCSLLHHLQCLIRPLIISQRRKNLGSRDSRPQVLFYSEMISATTMKSSGQLLMFHVSFLNILSLIATEILPFKMVSVLNPFALHGLFFSTSATKTPWNKLHRTIYLKFSLKLSIQPLTFLYEYRSHLEKCKNSISQKGRS